MKLYSLDIKRYEIVNDKKLLYPQADGSHVPNHKKIFKDLSGFSDILPTQIPELDYFYLRSYEKEELWEWTICDALGQIGNYPTGYNMFISEKFKNLLSEYNLGKHMFYSAQLLFKGSKKQYYLFKTVADVTKIIDYKLCQFESYDKNSKVIGDFSKVINNEDDYLKEEDRLLDENLELKFKKLVLWENKYDLMILPGLSSFAISERLKIAIEKHQITGVKIEPLPFEVSVSTK